MFSGVEDRRIKFCVQWEELLLRKYKISKGVRAHGLSWFLHLESRDGDVLLRVGFNQILEAPVTCATHIRLIVDSMDPNGAKYTFTRGTLALCGLNHCQDVRFPRALVEQHLLNDGWFSVFAELRIFKPVRFTQIPAHLGYSFSAPPRFVRPVAERDGIIYLLEKHSDVSPGIQKWAVQSMKAFDEESAVTLGLIEVKCDEEGDNNLRGSSINMETKEIGVTQVDEEEGRIRLDVVGLEGGVQTRIYPMPQNDIEFIKWSEAVMTSKGWMISANAYESDGLMGSGVAIFQFWLLSGQMTLFSELRRPAIVYDLFLVNGPVPYIPCNGFTMESINYNSLYCSFMSPGGGQLVLVCDLEEPSVWREYDMCPGLEWSGKLLTLWSHPVFVTQIERAEGIQWLLFKVEFTTTDCLLLPFLALPPAQQSVDALYENCYFNPETLVLTTRDTTMTVLHLITVPLPLKTLAVVEVRRLLGKMKKDKDALGQPIWAEWKKKLAKLIGHKTITCVTAIIISKFLCTYYCYYRCYC